MALERQRTDGELLAAVAARNGSAFSVFYRRHLPGVLGFLLGETGDREVAADLAAEVFAAVFLVAGRFRPREGGSAVPWVRGIVRWTGFDGDWFVGFLVSVPASDLTP